MDLKILFPAPPPTSNILTPAQRLQLLRTTTKLGRLLGATPRFVDQAPIALDLPLHDHDTAHRRKNSVDSVSSSSSSSSSPASTPPSSPASSLSSCSSAASFPSSHVRAQSNPSPPPSRTWRPHHRRSPPLLRLALQSAPTLETIPASPSSPPPAHSPYTLAPKPPHSGASPATPAPPGAAPAPTFRIPSSANTSVRRAKMDRVRRTLGDGVPQRLVFPPPDPLAAPQPRSDAAAGAPRAGAVGIQHQPKRERFVVHHAPHAQAPAPARVRASGTPPEGRLCVIAESLDEHGAGCSEEFGFVGSGEDALGASAASGSLRRRRGIDFGRALGLGEKRGRGGVAVA